nr:DUF6712 family protein [uncultured Flavobacterium sp.]
MKILFRESDHEDINLKSFLGFIDTDLNIRSLQADIRTSTMDLIKLVGKDVFKIAEDIYDKEYEDWQDNEIEFMYYMRSPIAIDSYRKFSPSNDLAHTNNGRKMRQDDGEKLPFEWMLDRDNKALEKRFYRALDDLLEYLEETDFILVKHTWLNSDNFKKTKKYFVSTVQDFNDVFMIESRLVLHKLQPSFKLFEELEIKPRLTNEVFQAYKDYFQNNLQTYPLPFDEGNNEDSEQEGETEDQTIFQNQLDDEQHILDESQEEVFVPDNELVTLIKSAAVNYALAWAMTRLSVQLFPEGILQFQISDRMTAQAAKPTLKMETEAARMAFEKESASFLKLIEEYLNRIKEQNAPPKKIEPINLMPNINIGDNFFNC